MFYPIYDIVPISSHECFVLSLKGEKHGQVSYTHICARMREKVRMHIDI